MADARRTVRDIATRVNLTPGPVQRRIARLEHLGVIEGYTVRVNRARAASGLEAVTELRFAGDTELDQIVQITSELPEVFEVLTTAGDTDALVRIRVDDVDHLQRVVNQLRMGPRVRGTRTYLVLGTWQRTG
jgi:DNA-binding Lrp family transcriptional regulator